MSKKLVLLLTFILWSIIALPLPHKADAQIPLTKAVVQSLRNLVRLIPQNQNGRPARVSDPMNPGDALATGRESLAELRFNDGSLARVGAQAVFKFMPNSRTFGLSNGTALLLIPPGRGETRVNTPNARAGIRGSALFVRYNPDTNTTIVGALTDSNIEVFNQNASQREGLRAGQMAVIVKDRIERIYDFDLKTFYETSDLVKGLNLTQTGDKASSDSAIAQVQAETSAAISAQTPIAGEGVIENPTFVQLPAASSDFPNASTVNNSTDISRPDPNFGFQNTPNPFNNNPSADMPPIEGGQVLSTQENLPSPPVQPPVVQPPVVETPVQPPVVQPPVVETPVQPPVVETPVQPPVVQPPVVETPVQPPVVQPPVVETPVQPPVVQPPVVQPPVAETPVQPPAGNPNQGNNGPPGPVGNPNQGNNGPPGPVGNPNQGNNGPPGPVGNPNQGNNGPPGPVGNPNQN